MATQGHLMQGITNSLGPHSADCSIQRRIQNPLMLNCFELPLAPEGVAVKDNQSLLLIIASGNYAYLVYFNHLLSKEIGAGTNTRTVIRCTQDLSFITAPNASEYLETIDKTHPPPRSYHNLTLLPRLKFWLCLESLLLQRLFQCQSRLPQLMTHKLPPPPSLSKCLFHFPPNWSTELLVRYMVQERGFEEEAARVVVSIYPARVLAKLHREKPSGMPTVGQLRAASDEEWEEKSRQ